MEDYAWNSGAAPEVPGFDVGRCLGRGGSATVWLVTEHVSGTEYALKCFAAGDGPGQGDTEEAIRREVRILSVLDHEHLVRARSVLRLRGSRMRLNSGDDGGDDIRDDGVADNPGGADLGLIMDYAAGGSLGQLLGGRGKLGPGETVTVLTPIAQALAYLHGHGFTHGDVSPGNVLFTAHGKPLLADLGVARMVADAAAAADAGTEGFRDPAPVDAVRAGLQPERDVYSLAALGWYCLTGRAPEPGAQRPPLPLLVPDVPAALAAALESGLQQDRRLRPSAAELAAAIRRSAVAEPVDLSVSVHPTVIPQLLTRRSLPRTARERRVERLRAVPLRFRRRRVVAPLPLAGQRGTGRPSRSDSARHAARRTSAGRRGVRVAAAGLALLGALAAAWGFAGAPLPPAFPGFAATGADAAKEPAGTLAPTAAEPGPTALDAAVLPPGVQAQLASQDPEEAVRGLSWLRSRAFSTGDFQLLDQVNVPASSAARADEQISATLEESGRVLTGFTTRLTHVARTDGSNRPRAVVAVTVSTSAYQERDAAGAVVAVAVAAPEQRLRLVLAPVGGRWRIQDILPAASG
ncbi:protein kinase domain-containing protein [Arthrobacter sp. U41]|uniref:serine/threonine protein kinase n=1 Tax=Arthrobacter sp. U41 TaxID=1849032 RepID=UPI0011A30629|nr:protein kinase [Arthrobacter sp. U41]